MKIVRSVNECCVPRQTCFSLQLQSNGQVNFVNEYLIISISFRTEEIDRLFFAACTQLSYNAVRDEYNVLCMCEV